MKKYSFLFVGILMLVGCRTLQSTEVALNNRFPSGRSETQGPIDDCLNHSFIYSRYDGLTSECTMNYVHYFSDKDYYQQNGKGKIKIGSFNLFHMGDNQAPLKDMALVANIMNQWDVVGAQELMPLPTDMAVSNHAISSLIAQTGENNEFFSKKLNVLRPGYLVLLNELRRLDPSWALILQPMPEGEGSSGEMAGFYYRGASVKLVEWSYCPADNAYDLKKQRPSGNFACLAQVKPEQRALMSRRAFVAYFQSGKFDFVGLTTHARFRSADTQEARDQQKDQICAQHSDMAKCKPTKDEVGRYYEVKAIADQISEIQAQSKDQDVIFMGDFNLEANDRSMPYWNAALKSAQGFEVFNKAPTTLGVDKNSLISNYDHFIFNPQAVTECSPATAKPFNFTSKTEGSPALQNLMAASSSPENRQQLINKRMSEFASIAKAKINAKDGSVSVGNMSSVEIEDCKRRFEATVGRMNANYTGAMLEIVSDHLPIEIECMTNGAAK